MKKLTLDALEVTTFETLPEPQGRGTVQGQAEPVVFLPSFEIEACGDPGDTDPFYCCTYGCTHESLDDNCGIVQP